MSIISMTEFQAKKLGEVLAFAQVGLDTIKKGQGSLKKYLASQPWSN
jgi:hypothetical protein